MQQGRRPAREVEGQLGCLDAAALMQAFDVGMTDTMVGLDSGGCGKRLRQQGTMSMPAPSLPHSLRLPASSPVLDSRSYVAIDESLVLYYTYHCAGC
ncbi:hypothetical protein PG989_015214 [Apiospora arundinis]